MTAALDLFSLFVEYTFGNVLFAIIALSGILGVICMIGRMSIMLTTSIIMLFLVVMLIGFLGSITAIFIFALSLIYFMYNLIPFVMGFRS